jgi:hypothetical protein
MFDSDWGGAVAWQKIEGQGMWGPWVMNIPERLHEIAASGKKNMSAMENVLQLLSTR